MSLSKNYPDGHNLTGDGRSCPDCEASEREIERLNQGIDAVYAMLLPLENQMVPNLLTIRQAIYRLHQLNPKR